MAKITSRERQILTLAANGLIHKETAGRLGISEQTVKNHLTNIMVKLGATTTIQAVTMCLKVGILNMEEIDGPLNSLTSMGCRWCRNQIPLDTKECPFCHHRADVPRVLCDCAKCASRTGIG